MQNNLLNQSLRFWKLLFQGNIEGNTMRFNNNIGKGIVHAYHISDELEMLLFDYTLRKGIEFKFDTFDDKEVLEYVPILFGEPVDNKLMINEEDGSVDKININSIGAFCSNSYRSLGLDYTENMGKPLRFISIRLRNDVFQKYISKSENIRSLFNSEKEYFIYEEFDSSMKETFNRLYEISEDSDYALDHFEVYAKFLVTSFFTKVNDRKTISKSNKYTYHLDPVYKAKEILKDKANTKITIDELSKECGLSGSRLRALFKETFGITIHQFQQDERLETSRKMLLEGNMTIMMIAMELGFSSASHFTMAFKKRFNITPKEFQKKEYASKLSA
ncbi:MULTISPECIES: AraC family transcriptional regulator [Flammeovirga]|uniref:AraC family transcriptional regulator n=1 Tax=Flammeovirga agarivorans TaxID=2726742 RepID=A0A7X8XU54_9BACT|nr:MULTISPECIES: AraC family transcriptional regulator [Flammeovirga]NLR90018.1 AraC family transcriptional regulator [Flammeovirga agarivorans]